MAIGDRAGRATRGASDSTDKPNTGLAERINAITESLTPAERRVAHVLASTNMIAGVETIQKLALRANVSAPSVLRFTTKLGFTSFADFHQSVAEDIRSRFTSPLDLYTRATAPQPGGLVNRALDAFRGGMERTLRRLDEPLLARIAKLLADPSRPVYCIGGRFTQHLAEMLWGHLYQLRPRAYVLRGGVVAAKDHLIEIGRGDVLVVFDVRRYQADTIELAEQAKARRAHIILITDTLLSPISRIAKDTLACDLDAPSPYDSLVPCMALIETIIAAVTEHAGERGRQRVEEIERLRSSESGARAVRSDTRSRRSNM